MQCLAALLLLQGHTDVSADRLANLSSRLAEVVVDPDLWSPLLGEIAEAAGGRGAVLLRTDISTPDTPRSESIDESIDYYFEHGWHLRDTRIRALPRWIRGEVVGDQHFLTPEEMARDECYRDVSYRFGYGCFAGIPFRSGDALWVLAIHRKLGMEHFSDGELSIFSAMRTRLTEVASLSRAVALKAVGGITDALSHVAQAAMVVSRSGKVLRLNEQAAALEGRDFRVSRGRVLLGDPAAADELAKVMDHLKGAPPGQGLGAAPVICRRQGRPSLLIRTLPVDPAISEPFLGAAALLLLTDLSTPPPRPAFVTVSSVLGLTLAEARVAVALSEGQSTSAISDQLGITVETVRTHLKRIYSKTGVEKQHQLTALVSRLGVFGGKGVRPT